MATITPSFPASIEDLSEETLHFDYPGSDIILRSCDSHDFRVPQLYLANCSTVLAELIRGVLNAPDVANSGEEQGPLPVVELSETGAIVHSLLTFIFPVTPTLPSTTENIIKLLAVAQKYKMDSILAHLRGAISRLDPPFILPETALHVYFLAQRYELHQEAVLAARSTLRLSMTIEDLGDKIDFMPGAYTRELWKYHESVREDLASGLLEFRRFGAQDIMEAEDLNCGAPPGPSAPSMFGSNTSNVFLGSSTPDSFFPQWLDGYIESLAQAPHLFDHLEFENARARHIKDRSASCSCVDISSQTRRAFWEALTTVVHGAMEKVRRSGATSTPHRGDEYELHTGRFGSCSRDGRVNLRKHGSSIRTIEFERTRCKYYNPVL
jgi:hypothetical protein